MRPLESFRLAASAPAHFIDPPEAVYASGEQTGPAARLDLDLTWTTDGVPYHYDLTTRYEIPCLVAGTVTVDGETFTVDGQGQRDHSWGVRDWWAFGWCWCSMRLDDGTRVHLADIRMDIGIPVFFGYIQQPEHGLVLPATALTVTEDLGPHGFPSKARIDIAAADSNPEAGSDLMQIGLDVTPVAFGPVLLRNDDGRTSRFPRAMVTCRTDDGRTGAGWIEWNQPDPAPAWPTPPERRDTGLTTSGRTTSRPRARRTHNICIGRWPADRHFRRTCAVSVLWMDPTTRLSVPHARRRRAASVALAALSALGAARRPRRRRPLRSAPTAPRRPRPPRASHRRHDHHRTDHDDHDLSPRRHHRRQMGPQGRRRRAARSAASRSPARSPRASHRSSSSSS